MLGWVNFGRPVGRLLTFVPDDVSIRIRTITARHSLVPTSQAGIAIGRFHNLLSPEGGNTRFPRSICEVCRVRCLLSTGRLVGHENAELNRSSRLRYHFWFKRKSHFRLLIHNGLYRRFRCLHHTSYLALIRFVATRRVRLSRFDTPHLVVLRYIVRTALYSGP